MIIAIAAFALAASSPAWAQAEIGHYQPGILNARDTIMPDPGGYYIQYDFHYHSSAFKDFQGHKTQSVTVGPITLDLDVDVDVVAVAPVAAWISSWEILGAHYGALVVAPFQNASVGAELTGRRFGFAETESNYGLGDMQFQPIWLGWQGERWNLGVSLGFFAPTGVYSPGSPNNVGRGFWSPYVQVSGSCYLSADKASAIILVGTYESNTQTEGEHVTGGDHLYLEYSFSQYLSERLELALSGYSVWQTTEDHGSDVTWDAAHHDQVHGIGGQVAYWLAPKVAQLSLRGIYEYGAHDRFQGYLAALNLIIVLGGQPPEAPPKPK